jgi:hypothetical protein
MVDAIVSQNTVVEFIYRSFYGGLSVQLFKQKNSCKSLLQTLELKGIFRFLGKSIADSTPPLAEVAKRIESARIGSEPSG